MATVNIIPVEAAPEAPRKISNKAEFSRGVLRSLTPGFAAELTPEDDETARGLRVSLARASRDLDIKVHSWEFDGRIYTALV